MLDIDQVFSVLARELNRMFARTIPELIASFRRAYANVHVEVLDKVVNMWRTIESRSIPNHNMTLFYSFQIRRNADGRVVLRTKDFMHHDVWHPVGKTATDVSFAPPMLSDPRSSAQVPDLHYVVSNVLDVSGLSAMVEAHVERLSLTRSAVIFPNEVAGDALTWWRNYLQTERARIAAACPQCVAIRTELRTIVISQQNKCSQAEKKVNCEKSKRRDELQTQLQAHECRDRSNGSLSVSPEQPSLLFRLLASLRAGPVHRVAVRSLLVHILICVF